MSTRENIRLIARAPLERGMTNGSVIIVSTSAIRQLATILAEIWITINWKKLIFKLVH